MTIGRIMIGVITICIQILIFACSSEDEKLKEETIQNIEEQDYFMMGVDLSYVNQVEDYGGVYKENEIDKDVYKILKEKGANTVRLRIWNNPEWIFTVYDENVKKYSALEDVKKSIKRAKALGMAVNLDFHYSDVWADPAHQNVPDAWSEIKSIEVLCDSVYNFTYRILEDLYKENLLPEMVQIGNETNCGMMHTETKEDFPKLSICDNEWVNFGKVLNSGIKAVRDIDEKAGQKSIIALHVADPKNLDWWFSDVITKANVTDFDVAGFSYYPHWHKDISFAQLPDKVKQVKADIKKEIMILETAYPFTIEANDNYNNIFNKDSGIEGYPLSIDGQYEFLRDLTQNMIDAGAKGVMYWEPAWITSDMKDLWGQGSAWENASLFDYSGNVTMAADYMLYNYNK